MKQALKLTAAIIALVLLIAAVQTAERRFSSFGQYMDIGYGNVPYGYKNTMHGLAGDTQ